MKAKLFTSRKTKTGVIGVLVAGLWVGAVSAAVQLGWLPGEHANTALAVGLSVIGALFGVNVAGIAHEDAATKRAGGGVGGGK